MRMVVFLDSVREEEDSEEGVSWVVVGKGEMPSFSGGVGGGIVGLLGLAALVFV